MCNTEKPEMVSTAMKKISTTSEITKYGRSKDDFNCADKGTKTLLLIT